MVIIRIKNNENNNDNIPKYLSNENIKISTKIKPVKILKDDGPICQKFREFEEKI
jgi:hypothetical protein